MKVLIAYALLVIALSAGVSADAAEDKLTSMPVQDVLTNPEYAGKFEGVKFYFGNQSYPGSAKKLGSTNTNKKTNSFAKSDVASCQRAMASALIAIANDAKASGGNAVVNIKSNYKSNLTSSETEYVCGRGGIMSGVALVGDVVRLP